MSSNLGKSLGIYFFLLPWKFKFYFASIISCKKVSIFLERQNVTRHVFQKDLINPDVTTVLLKGISITGCLSELRLLFHRCRCKYRIGKHQIMPLASLLHFS